MVIYFNLVHFIGIWAVIWMTLAYGMPTQEDPTSDEGSDECEDLFDRLLNNYTNELEDIVKQYNTDASTLSKQNQRLEKLESLQNSRPIKIQDHISQMVNFPHAKLFSEENFTGESEDYRFDTSTFEGGCHSLENLKLNVKSVRTFGKCVRLFHGDKCTGCSAAVYPGSDISENDLYPELEEVESIGPCLPEEFENAHFKGTGSLDVVKDAEVCHKHIPDLTEFYSFGKYQQGENASTASPFSVTRHTLGPNNRLEYISSNIFPKHVNMSQGNFDIEETEFYLSLKKEEGDVVGYAIPLSIGGPANETYNVFPQSSSSAKALAILASKIRMHDQFSTMTTVFHLNLMYEDDLSTRPYALHYWINFGDSRIEYGRIWN